MDTRAQLRRRSRPWRWLCRYAPAEAAGLLVALAAAAAVHPFGVAGLTAFAAATGESVAFYAVVVLRDMRGRSRRRSTAGTLVRDVLLEFGPAEALDTLLVRPLAMYLATAATGNLTMGVLLGKVIADVMFYAVAIVGYELGQARRAKAKSGVVAASAKALPDPGPTIAPAARVPLT
jgi:hypothetical protein